MDTLSYKTISVNKENANKKWYIVDAEGQVLGRLASEVAQVLRGKRKTCFTPHSDCGDNVIIINAEKVVLTGKKLTEKTYVHHTGSHVFLWYETCGQLLGEECHSGNGNKQCSE